MSTKKILSVVLFTLFIFICQGCKKQNTEVIDILNKYQNIEAIDMYYSVNLIDSDGYVTYDDNKYIYKMRKDEDNFYAYIYGLYSSYYFYYVNDYRINGSVELSDETSDHGTKFFNLDFKNVNYKMKKEVDENNSTIYTLIARDEKVSKQIEKLINKDIKGESRIDLKLIMKENKLNTMNIIYEYNIGKKGYTYKADITINAIKKDVKFTIPNSIFFKIQEHENGQIDYFPNRVLSPNNNAEDIVTISEDGKLKTLQATTYSKAICDDKYIYTIDKYSNYLNIFEIDTLKRVKRELLENNLISMDADNGKLVLGFRNQLKVYDTSTWYSYTKPTGVSVQGVVILYDMVYFSSNYLYNLNTRKEEYYNYLSSYWRNPIINREEGFMYYIDDGSIIMYDIMLKRKNNFYISESVYELKYDGNFIHVNKYLDGYVYDKSGNRISSTPTARIYKVPGVSKGTTIYDNNVISMFLGKRDNNYVTIVYDLFTDEILYEYIGTSTSASKVGNKYIIFDEYNNVIRTLDIN